jgi:hypothetical protein
MKYWAFEYNGHGHPSYYLVAETKNKAISLVTEFVSKNMDKDDEPYIKRSDLDEMWIAGRYNVTEIVKGIVAVNHNS